VTIIAGRTHILITGYALMFILKFIRIVVFVAENTFKYCIIVGIDMTIRTIIPFALVSSGINWKILIIVIPGGLIPVAGIMAGLTLGWKSCSHMIRISGNVKIVGVTGITVGWRAGITIGMAVYTLQV
jgi:hypothetical protein